METANEEQAPIIIMAEQRDLLHAGVEFMVKMAEAALAVAEVPVAFHLDHGRDMELLKRGIGAGFSSVMFDGSQLSFEENIRLTGQVVSWAEERGVSVEAELGHVALAGAEGDGAPTDGLLTDPAMVPPFVEATGVHALAVAIGTAHGYTQACRSWTSIGSAPSQEEWISPWSSTAVRAPDGRTLSDHRTRGVQDQRRH